MSVIDELKAIGGEQLEGFNQTSYRGNQTDVNGVDITNGYCAGVVLDWARRVLQSAPNRDQGHLGYKTQKPDAEKRRGATVNRMATAYAGQAPSYFSGDTNKITALALLGTLTSGQQVHDSDYGTGFPVSNAEAKLFQKFWQIPGGPDTIFGKFNFNYQRAGVLDSGDIEWLKTNLNGKPDPQLSPSVHGRQWETFAAQLDGRFIQERIAKGLKPDPKKLFGNLEVVHSSVERNYDQAGQWNYELFTNGFKENCCTVVGFKPSAGGSGHAVAAHQKGVDEFVFFDPNYGAFRYSREDLQACFQLLFWKPVFETPPQGVLDGHKAVYLRREKESDPVEGRWDKMGFTIFRRKNG